MSDLEEVDVEKQLKAAEESGEDTASIVLSEPEDDDEEDDSVGVENLAEQDVGDVVEEDEMGKESDIEDEEEDEENNPGIVLETTELPTSNFVGEKVELDEISSEEESDDDEYDENMQKLEQELNQDFIQSYHPETKQINHLELDSKIKIQRIDNIIKDENHTTIPIMTRYEKAKILGLRSSQINSGADVFIEVPPGIIDGITIAKMELEAKKIPFIIRRPLPNGKSEYWDIKDLEILD